jgi:hypothetical protein
MCDLLLFVATTDTAFRQQRTRALRPVQTPHSIVTVYFLIGIVQLIFGILLFKESKHIETYKIQYGGRGTHAREDECQIESSNQGRQCNVTFHVLEDMEGPVFLYYKLTNFYAVHQPYFFLQIKASSKLLFDRPMPGLPLYSE